MLWWHPCVLIAAIIAAWVSYRLNCTGHWGWIVLLSGLNMLPLWGFIARRSTALLLDGIVYDILLTVGYTVTLIYLTKGSLMLTPLQWLCVTVILVALIILKAN